MLAPAGRTGPTRAAAKERHRQARPQLNQHWNDDMNTDMNAPIFIFSAGWRSGSTLLQRYLTATGGVLMWGECGGAISHLRLATDNWAQMLGEWNKRFEDGPGGNGAQALEEFKEASKRGAAAEVWSATMNPPVDHLLASVRNFLLDYYGKSALELGYSRWGAKYVNEDVSDATFLKQLFPDARFLFLVRDPLKSILSIKRHDWMHRQPSFATLTFFAKHWQRLARGFAQTELGLLVRYEDFVRDRETQRRVLEYVQLPDAPADFIKVSRVDWHGVHEEELSRLERGYLKWLLHDEMATLDYK